jgi:hypothetical protein
VRFDDAIGLWQEGARRLQAADPPERRALERVSDEIVTELHRRLGGAFSSAELAELYSRGTDWCFDIATRTAPDSPEAWDIPTVAGAAFARYLREASDYSGGRRVDQQPTPPPPPRRRRDGSRSGLPRS